MKNTVLIVDDEPDVLESTAELVESLGYRAVRLADPAGILEAIETKRPDVLLQDLKMPGLNVSGLVAAIRSNPSTAELPIIFFSANAALPAIAARLDAWGVLAKPFAKQDLARLLQEAVGPANAPTIKAGTALQKDVRGVFHDYWNLLSALSNYVVLLDESANLPNNLQKTVRALDEVVLRLESKTDRLQTYLLGLVASLEPRRTSEHPQGSSESMADPL